MTQRDPTEHPVDQEIEAIAVVYGANGSGDDLTYRVGTSDVTRIEATTKSGMHANIPYVRVWKGDVAVAEYCQHNIVGVYFKEPT